MNTKRSYLRLFVASAGVALFLANCTINSSSGDTCKEGDKDVGCDCPGSATGYQVCDADGVFGACQCPGSTNTAGTSNGSAGTNNSSNGGSGNTTEGGAPSSSGKTGNTAGSDATAGAPMGEGGAGGAAPLTFDPVDCEDCLGKLCSAEFDACLDDDTCFAQYAAIKDCIETERQSGLVKRDVVRGCGVTVGNSPNPDLISDWAPQEMSPLTTDLINCMATSASDPQGPNADWANDPANFPNDVPTPWPADSCAKLSCTSQYQ